MSEVPETSVAELADRYDALLLDAYGVLNDDEQALPGAAEVLRWLDERGKPWFVVTNDASRLESTCAARFARLGLRVQAERIVTSGSLLEAAMAGRGLHGARCINLGTEDSAAYIERGGGVVVPWDGSKGVDAVIVADDDGYPFLPAVEGTLSAVARSVDAGHEVTLLLPNPDVVYPKRGRAYGFTSGAVALLLEAGWRRLFGAGAGLDFEKLGKPHAPLFTEAMRRADTRHVVMVGDQIETDIRGARWAGIDAALVLGGVSRGAEGLRGDDRPTYILSALRMA